MLLWSIHSSATLFWTSYVASLNLNEGLALWFWLLHSPTMIIQLSLRWSQNVRSLTWCDKLGAVFAWRDDRLSYLFFFSSGMCKEFLSNSISLQVVSNSASMVISLWSMIEEKSKIKLSRSAEDQTGDSNQQHWPSKGWGMRQWMGHEFLIEQNP